MLETFKTSNEIISLIIAMLRYIPEAIFSYIYTVFFLKYAYEQIGERGASGQDVSALLDVGASKGDSLKVIAPLFLEARILGIDYNRHYIQSCKKLFQENPSVEFKHMDFHDLEKKQPDSLFDIIIFKSSKLILPDETKTIEIAKRKLRRGGKMYFMLTLHEQKTFFDNIMAHVKPYLKYLIRVNFDLVTYRRDFENFLLNHGLTITSNQHLSGNIFLKMSKFWLYEVTKA